MPHKIPGWMPVEPGEPNAQQIVDGQWYAPEHGCDSLAMMLDGLGTDWISVTDELPPANEDVLICAGGTVEIGHRTAGSHWRSRGWTEWDITHWRPMPPPPEVDDE